MKNLPRLTVQLGIIALILLPPQRYLAGEMLRPADSGPLPGFVTVAPDWFGLAAQAQGYDAASGKWPPTAAYVDRLELYIRFCDAIGQRAYMVDCLAERFGTVAAAMPASGDRAGMRAALEQASAQLAAVAYKYRWQGRAPVTFATTSGAQIKTSRALQPVAPENQDRAFAAAAAIVAQAQTVLLRASGQSQDRALDFQQVAAVIGSTKVLLRSS